MATYHYPTTYIYQEIDTYSKLLELDSFINYVIPIPFDSNNQYYIPFTDEDVFNFCTNETVSQVQFFEQCSEDEIVQLSAVTINGKCFTIDFSEFADSIKCFRIKVNGQPLEYGFTRADDGCRNTVTIESFYETYDPLGYSYIGGSYSNKTRLFAELEHVGQEKEVEEQDGEVISTKVYEVYELRLTEGLKQGSFILNKLLNSILLGKDITVITNGVTHVFDKHIDGVNKDNDLNEDWYSTIVLRKKPIEVDYIC